MAGATGSGHTGFTKGQRQAMLSGGLVAVAASVVANVVETGFISLLDAGSGELLWISDVGVDGWADDRRGVRQGLRKGALRIAYSLRATPNRSAMR